MASSLRGDGEAVPGQRFRAAVLVPVAAAIWEGEDAPLVVLRDAVGHLRHRRVKLRRRLVEGCLVVLHGLVVLHRRVVQDLERLAARPELLRGPPTGGTVRRAPPLSSTA